VPMLVCFSGLWSISSNNCHVSQEKVLHRLTILVCIFFI